jgi:hypothetical protein
MGAVASRSCVFENVLVLKLRLALSAAFLGEGKAKDSDTWISVVGVIWPQKLQRQGCPLSAEHTEH